MPFLLLPSLGGTSRLLVVVSSSLMTSSQLCSSPTSFRRFSSQPIYVSMCDGFIIANLARTYLPFLRASKFCRLESTSAVVNPFALTIYT
jgi:hypothetical protein